MSARGWSARTRTEKFQIVFGTFAMSASVFTVLDANFFIRIAVLFVSGLVGAGIGFAVAQMSDRTV
jgi:hypothetical protein